MTDTITTIRLGYGGYANLDGETVLITSGNMENNVSPAYTNGYAMPNDNSSRSKILHSDGTVTHTGQIGFDLTTSSLNAVTRLLQRNKRFTVGLYDGQYGMEMKDCVAESISLSGSPSGLLSGSVSFTSEKPSQKKSSSSTNIRDNFIGEIIPYWWSGNSYVRDWALSFSQSVSPRYANKNEYLLIDEGILASSPLYLFVGEVECRLDFSTFCPLVTDTVYIRTDAIKIVGRTVSTGYALTGQNDLPTYKYSIVSHAVGFNNENMLTIG